MSRRLTAILAADVAGYSRLMGVDEERTHGRLYWGLGSCHLLLGQLD
jgi:class 3 adenylate cyclase